MLFFKFGQFLSFLGLFIKFAHSTSLPNAAICNEKGLPDLQNPDFRFADLGRDLPLCKAAISAKLRTCHRQYIDNLSALCTSTPNQKAMCCAFWNSKECMHQAFNNTKVCASKKQTFDLFLLNEQELKYSEENCPEYGPNSPVCQPWKLPISWKVLGTFLFFTVAVVVVIIYFCKYGIPDLINICNVGGAIAGAGIAFAQFFSSLDD